MTAIESLFKSYDVRGTTPVINEQIYYLVARGFAQKILKPRNKPLRVCVIHDGRYTSQEFYQATIQGLLEEGAEPISLGLGSTDMLYAACQLWQTSGIMITASHNPKDDNGIKIVLEPPTMLGLGSGLEHIRDFVINNYKEGFSIPQKLHQEENKIEQGKLIEFFTQKITQIGEVEKVNNILNKPNKKLKFVVDCGNGMGGYIMSKILPNLYPNLEFIPLFWEIDGNFPNHHPDPQNYANLRDLQAKIAEVSADGGFAFDGDGDRVFFVDENSDIINGDFLNTIIAKDILENYDHTNSKHNNAVVFAQSASRCFSDTIIQNAGMAISSKQGHTFIKQKMLQTKAIYGGEFSGHHYFADFGYMDSGVIAAAYVIKILVEKNTTLSSLTKFLNQSYFISDLINIQLKPNQNFETIKNNLKAEFKDADTISEFDGLSIYYPDWKFSLRPSNTEPKVRLIVETRFQNITQKKLELLRSIIAQTPKKKA